MNNKSYIALCVTQMAYDEKSAATIAFFRAIAPTLLATGKINGKSASELTFMTPQGAGKHIKNMTQAGYLVRQNRRRWALADRFIKHPDIVPLARHLYSEN